MSYDNGSKISVEVIMSTSNDVDTLDAMPKSKPQSRSLFAALPVDLKRNLRSQVFVRPPDASINLDIKKELLNTAVDNASELLATQPASPSASPDEIVHEFNASLPPPVEAAEPISGPSKPPAWARGAKEVLTPSSHAARSATSNGKRPAAEDIRSDLTAEGASSRKKQKRKSGKKAGNAFASHRWDCTGLVPRYTAVEQVPNDLIKYWYQRLTLLPRYDELPLLLDHTGWFSITPHPIAEQIALRCQCDVIVDAFCGVGGNTIEFAKTCERVIAIDNDPTRLRLARHNALQLGVADRIEFILADFVSWAKQLALRDGGRESVDVIFLSPPWGGMDYLTSGSTPASIISDGGKYPLASIQPIHGAELYAVCAALTPNIAYYLPRNADLAELGQLANPLAEPSTGEHGQWRDREWVEVEEEWFGEKLKAITAYFGGLIAED